MKCIILGGMKMYTWGVDAYGRQHICEKYGTKVIFCVIPGGSVWDCINLLEMQ